MHTSFSLREGCRQTLRSADQPPDVSSLHTLPRFSEVFPPTSQLQNPQSRRTRNHHILELCDECTVAHVPSAVIIPRGPASCLRERELSVAFVVLLGLQSRVRNGWGRQTCIGLPEGRQKAPQNLHHQIVDVWLSRKSWTRKSCITRSGDSSSLHTGRRVRLSSARFEL